MVYSGGSSRLLPLRPILKCLPWIHSACLSRILLTDKNTRSHWESALPVIKMCQNLNSYLIYFVDPQFAASNKIISHRLFYISLKKTDFQFSWLFFFFLENGWSTILFNTTVSWKSPAKPHSFRHRLHSVTDIKTNIASLPITF